MKYYLYRSVAKIEMLWEQLSSQEIEKYSGELKVSLGVVSASIKSEPVEKNLHGKIEMVVHHLQKHHLLGDLRNPLDFVNGVMPMTWQPMAFSGDDTERNIVLFSGYTDAPKILVALVGSASYVTGMNDLRRATVYYASPAIWERIEALAEDVNLRRGDEIGELDCVETAAGREASENEDASPKRTVEFVARVFTAKPGVIIGSPLYVAEA